MKKLWGKIYKNNRLIKNYTAEITGETDENGNLLDVLESSVTALIEICEYFDIENPIWLDSNKDEFRIRQKTIFRPGNFIDEPDFDRMEIEIIE